MESPQDADFIIIYYISLFMKSERKFSAWRDVLQQIDFAFIDDRGHICPWVSILWRPQDLQLAHIALIVFVVDGDRANGPYNRIIRLYDAIHFLE